MINELDIELMESERIRIRPWQYRDLIAQESWPRYGDPFSSFWNTPRSHDWNGSRSYFYSSNIRRVWAVENCQYNLIGRISLRELEPHVHRARLGISLGSPFVGQGLGTEALALFLDHFFGVMGFHAMLLDVAAFNRRAVRCYEGLGFRYVGSDWRHIGPDPSLRLLDDPAYSELVPFFRRERRGAWVQFFEMKLHKDSWMPRLSG